MGIWRKAIVTCLTITAVGAACILADARPLATRLVPERATGSGNLLVEVETERINIYSSPHDGLGHIGGLVGPLLPSIAVESPPDLMLCLVRSSAIECQANGASNAPTSYCHDSFQCKWQLDVGEAETFALVVFDLDVFVGRSVSDLIDVVLVPGGDPPSDALKRKTRRLIEEIAPTAFHRPELPSGFETLPWRPSEARRRMREFVEAPVQYCAGKCDLEQSSITLSWVAP